MTTGLILVDVQNDFIDGSLAVNSANSIISTINYLLLHHQFKLIIASQDYHPRDHISFASTHQGLNQFTTISINQNGNQVLQELWPDHCVEGSRGVEIETSIRERLEELGAQIIRKGTDINVDAYSAFAPKNENNVSILEKTLLDNDIKTIVIVGIATDYCVRQTTLSALKIPSIETIYLVREGVNGVDAAGSEAALNELSAKGVKVVSIHGEEMKQFRKSS